MKRRRKDKAPAVPSTAVPEMSGEVVSEGVRLIPAAPRTEPDAPVAEPKDDFSVTAAFGLARVDPDGEPPTPPSLVAIIDGEAAGSTADEAPGAAPAPRPARPSKPALVIGDDDLPDAVELSQVPPQPSGAAIDPRLRRRRIAVRRAAGRKRLVVAISLGVVFLLVAAALVVLASPLFGVRDIVVSGDVYTSPVELAEVLDPLDGSPILTLDTDAVAARLEALPWVRRARVETEFPSTLYVELSERQPVATYAGGDGRWRVIDREGRVIAVIPDGAQPADYLPIEATGPDVVAGQPAGDLYRVAGELAMSLPTELRNVTSSITLTANGEIGLRLTSATVVTFGQPTDLRRKLTVLIEVLRQNDPAELVAVNLSDPDSPGKTLVGS